MSQVGGKATTLRRAWTQGFPTSVSRAPAHSASHGLSEDHVTVRVCRPTGCVELRSRYLVIATGSRPSRPKVRLRDTVPSKKRFNPGNGPPGRSRRLTSPSSLPPLPRLPDQELRPGVPIPYTSRLVIDATQIANLKELPDSLAVIGGGVISVEYATVFAAMGLPTSLLCREDAFLPFLPPELQTAIKADMARNGIEVIHNPVSRFEVGEDKMVRFEFEGLRGGEGGPVEEDDGGRRQLEVGLVLYSGGRDANSEKIGCEEVGVEVGKYGRIVVDKDFRTGNPRVFAIGDVIGPPGLASFAQQSARVVTDLLFRGEREGRGRAGGEKGEGRRGGLMGQAEVTLEDWAGGDDFFAAPDANAEEEEEKERERSLALLKRMEAPLTLWTVPEIASSGMSTEEALARGERLAETEEQGGGIVFGYAFFKDLARGRLSGDLNGFLKIIARAEGGSGQKMRHTIIGVHIVGDGANELIQLGSMLVHSHSTLEELSNMPFAAVTLSCLYQVASDDALCRSPFSSMRKPADVAVGVGERTGAGRVRTGAGAD